MRFKVTNLVKGVLAVCILVAIGATVWYWVLGKKPDAESASHEDHDDHEKEEPSSSKVAENIDSVEVVPAAINIYVKAPGTIEFHPEKALRLHPAFAGVVTRVHKDLGDQVRAGDALATIDSSVGLQTFTLTSPIAGTVLGKSVSNGQTVSPEEELFAVGDTSILRARLSVAARDIKKIKAGQEVLLVSEKLDRIRTKVHFVSPILSEDTRTATTIADFSSDKFRPGMFVTGALKEDVKNVEKSIPAALCNSISNKVTLSVISKDGIEKRQVTTGVSDFENCEIMSGLASGDRVVLSRTVGSKAEEKSSSDD